MTGEATRVALNWIASEIRQSEADRRECEKMLKERDEARLEAEDLKAQRDSYRAAHERISGAYNSLQSELAAERAKKASPVEGTWAWACEQLLAGKRVRADGWNPGVFWVLTKGMLIVMPKDTAPHIMEEMIKATDWRVVES